MPAEPLPDELRIRGGQLELLIGLTEDERRWPQQILVDLCFPVDARPAGASDDLCESVDYAAVWTRLAEVARARPRKLLEALAEDIAAAIFEGFPIPALTLTLRKPGALRGAGVPEVALTIRRERPR